jgi:hypothetical protein
VTTPDAPFGYLPDGSPILWRVLDPEGNVVQAGGMSHAHATAELGEAITTLTEGA